MDNYNTTKEMLDAFQQAWSQQDKESILEFFSNDLVFEDIPLGIHASNKAELFDILNETFSGVPNFKMEIFEYYEGSDFIITKWKQSGNMTVKGYGLDLDSFPYEVITTSIIKRNESGLITSISDNWNTGVFYQ